ITESVPSDSPFTTYEYVRDDLLRKKSKPDGRYMAFEYYPQHIGDPDLNSDADRVMKIMAPANRDGSECVLREFSYDIRYSGTLVTTTVKNALDLKTVYHCSYNRVDSIHNYEADSRTQYTSEWLTWGEKKSQDAGNLMKRVFKDGQGQVL